MGGGLNALGWMLGVVLSVTDFVNNFIGYAILVLMVPVSIWTFLPWIRRIRIGLAPLDAEASQTDSQNASNREAFAIALGVLRKEGQELAKDYELENKPCNQWIARVTDLIGAALGEEEAITFKEAGEQLEPYLDRHASGDWSETDPDERRDAPCGVCIACERR